MSTIIYRKSVFDSPCPAFKRLSADAGTLFVNRHNKQHTMSVYAQDRYRPLALVSQRLGVPLSHSDHDQIQKSGPGATCDRENSGNTQRIQRALCHSHLQNRLRSKPRPHPLPIPSHTLRGGCHWHDQEAHGKTVSSNTLSQGATLGRIILDRRLLHRHGQQSRHKGNHYEIH